MITHAPEERLSVRGKVVKAITTASSEIQVVFASLVWIRYAMHGHCDSIEVCLCCPMPNPSVPSILYYPTLTTTLHHLNSVSHLSL